MRYSIKQLFLSNMIIKKLFFSQENLGVLLLVFIIYSCFAPAVRILTVGGNEMKNFYEFVITALPDLLLLIVSSFGFIVWLKGNKFQIIALDKTILFFVLFNTLYGLFLARNIFIFAQGFRVTYLPVIFYFIGRIFLSNKNLSKEISKNIFSWFILFGIIGLILHFAFRNFEIHLIELSLNHESVYFIPRIGSMVLMPVLFATLMAITSLYFYFRLLTENKNWFYWIIAILWSCIFLSVSRGPIFAFIIGFLFLSFLFRQWGKSLIVLGIIIFVSSLWSYILTDSLTATNSWIFSSTVDTLEFGEGITRVELWKLSIHDFIQRPWGYGLGHAGVTAIRFLKGTGIPAAVYTSDGWFLKLACETGIPGLISYLLLAGIFFFKGWNYISQNKFSFFTFVFAIFIMINAQCIVSNTLDFYPYTSLYWLLIGFSVNYLQKQ